MGAPERPTREQLRALEGLARATEIREFAADAEGTFAVELELAPWALVLITTR